MRVLVLVIASFDKPVYYDMLNVWKERCGHCPFETDVWFVRSKPDSEWIGDIINDILDPELKDRYELDIFNKTIFVRGDECLIPGILNKTVEAISYFLGERSLRPITPPSQNGNTTKLIPHYDFIWRTNLSSVLDFHGLHAYISGLQSSDKSSSVNSSVDSSLGFYGGYIGKASSYFFASGAGFLMSRDVASYLVTNKHLLRWDLIDDVAIGALLEPRFGLVPIDRCWVDENFSGCPDVFHFRCESYLHLRTVEFMNAVNGNLRFPFNPSLLR